MTHLLLISLSCGMSKAFKVSDRKCPEKQDKKSKLDMKNTFIQIDVKNIHNLYGGMTNINFYLIRERGTISQ